MSIKVAINGFGRIGRLVARGMLKEADIDLVAVNDITDAKTLAHLFSYDSIHGHLPGVSVEGDEIFVGEERFKVFAKRDPADLPWKELGVDVVVESTGLFRDRDSASKHITAGAKKVVISAPAKNEDITIVLGVNENLYDPGTHNILSNASCTTNCLAPVCKVLDDEFGISHGLMTTIHSYTSDQCILDMPHPDLRRARAAAMSMIPTSTGAARAIGLVMPQLKGKIDGFAIRVPTSNVSVVDLGCILKKEATPEAVNAAMKKAAEGELKGILRYVDEPLVSIDFVGDSHSSLFDSGFTRVIEKTFVKILSWYDNEWGYSMRVIDLVKYIMDKA
ncbi:MAG: type I glyceraldehyde-3-phosphate dehydrogenase [Candidatus Cloacimonetes bacterium 4572_55]|nr:MAG: type I glyceraldehyde-3-phosphate dehydrogenase [Candidatus Cloacimonetes bacterium 4572_55]